MFQDVEEKRRKHNQILFSRSSLCLQNLLYFMRRCTHQELLLWALSFAKEILLLLESIYPDETRFRTAYQKTIALAKGEIKMPEAKRAILDCHAVAKKLQNSSHIAFCHALGQGLSTVHVETHAIGLCIYELTAIVFKHPTDYVTIVSERVQEYIDRLFSIHENFSFFCGQFGIPTFVPFLEKDVTNREQVLLHRRFQKRIVSSSIYDVLEQLSIPYQEVRHKPVYTVEDAKSIPIEISGIGVKNLFLKDASNHYFLYLLEDDKRADLKSLAKFLHTSHLHFGSEEELQNTLHLSRGSCTPFGIISDDENVVVVILSESLLSKKLLFHPNRNDRTISIFSYDLIRFIEAEGHVYLIY